MSKELYWLVLTTIMTGIFWVPYVLNRFLEIGIIPAVFQPNADITPNAIWARRMVKAHANAIENLVVFAVLIIVVEVLGVNTALTATAAMLYFFARLGHFIVYTMGVPALRTISFLVGFGAQMLLGLTILGLM